MKPVPNASNRPTKPRPKLPAQFVTWSEALEYEIKGSNIRNCAVKKPNCIPFTKVSSSAVTEADTHSQSHHMPQQGQRSATNR